MARGTHIDVSVYQKTQLRSFSFLTFLPSKCSFIIVKKEKMGKRGIVTKKNERAQMLDSSMEDQLESSNPSLKRTELSTEIITDQLANLAALRNNMLENAKAIPRRSKRIQNTVSSSQVQDIEPVIENIEASENEEDDQQCCYEEKRAPEAILAARSMEEKIEHLILLLEVQGKTIKAFLSKVAGGCFPTQNPIAANIGSEMKRNEYKNMFKDSQKKIDDLRDENYELSKKLEIALGKLKGIDDLRDENYELSEKLEIALGKLEGIDDLRDKNYELSKKLEIALGKLEGYEKGQLVFSEAIEKLKDACLVSSLTKTTEMVLGLSSAREIMGGCAAPTASPEAKSPASKRRKVVRGEARFPAAERKKVVKGEARSPAAERKKVTKASKN